MITAKQNEFAQQVSDGLSQTKAYRSAYSSDNMAPKTVWEESSRLRRHPKVAARINRAGVRKGPQTAHTGALTRRENIERA